jgi:hemoglobin
MFASLVLGMALVAVVSAPAGAQAKGKPLYVRLGGKAAIAAVVNEFVSRVGADNRINKYFAATVADTARLAAFKSALVDQICQATGGHCHYMGKDMKTAHAGMGISHADFAALVEDLSGALDQLNVQKGDKEELLDALAPMERDIVEGT